MAYQHRKTGFTMLEVIVALGGLSVLFLVVLSLFNIVSMQKSTEARALAEQLLQEEAEALRAASFSDLGVRATTPFIEVAYNRGRWQIDNPVGPQTAPNTLHVDATGSTSDPSYVVVPTGDVADGTYETYFRVRSGTPVGWMFGIYLHYHDDQNNYLLRGTADGFAFIKTVEGVPTTVWQAPVGISLDVWRRLTVVATGTAYSVFLDGASLNSSAIIDAEFTHGNMLLAAFGGASIDFDTVKYIGVSTLTWNFDNAAEFLGMHPLGWNRPSPGDLESGATSVSIADAQSGFTDLKRVTLAVTWFERGATRLLSSEFDINEFSVNP